MKGIWMLSVLFAFAGCQPAEQEGPMTPPASVAKSDSQTETMPAAVPPKPQEEIAKIVAVPQKVKPAQPKTAPEEAASKPEVVIAPPAAPIAEPARVEKAAGMEQAPALTPAPKAQFSEAEAMALAKKKNCFACHSLDKKVVGPAWRAVAEKYRGDTGAQAALESKVRKGGKGNWGSIAMPPQPSLSGEELAGLVQFVLQLK